MNDAAVFWDNVKKEIKLQNTTQEWIAKDAGISFNTFQGWVSKSIYPRANEAVRIAQALNTSVEYLVGEGVSPETVRDNKRIIDTLYRHLPEITKHLEELMVAAGVTK